MSARCRCGHARDYHDSRRRLCHGSTVCACDAYRPENPR